MQVDKLLDDGMVVRVRDLFTEDDKKDIEQELRFLVKKGKCYPPQLTGSAYDHQRGFLKENSGIFLDMLYTDHRRFSDILRVNRKIFDGELVSKLISLNKIFTFVQVSTRDATLVSHYVDGDFYKSHRDNSIITAIIYYWDEPKSYKGGDLYFEEYGLTVSPEKWDVLFFPSFMMHEVKLVEVEATPVSSDHVSRTAISTFISLRND